MPPSLQKPISHTAEMPPSATPANQPPFALLTPDLVFLPTPAAAHVHSYRTLFRKLHADAGFCQVAFGHHFQPVIWTDDEVRDFLLNRDAALRWGVRGMGDFALGMLPVDGDGKTAFHGTQGRWLKDSKHAVKVVQGDGDMAVLSGLFDNVEWAGYTCVRDATTSSVADLYAADNDATLPPWEEMVEIRYGMDPSFRGRGIATRAAEVVMDWAKERGVRRFIAETQKANSKSAQVLGRLGFERSDTTYFQDEGAVEWVRVVA